MERVLIVDDERSIRATLSALLQAEGYETVVAEDAQAAQARMAEQSFDVVLSDVVLPRTSGVALLHSIRATNQDVEIIMMTGEPTVDTATEAVRAGASDYLSKPVTKDALLRSIARAAKMKRLTDERKRLAIENQRYQRDLERLVEERTRKLEEAILNWKAATEGTILAMASAVEMRDPYTAGHQERVAHLARAMAVEMQLGEDEVNATYYAGLVHDLGKISVPAEILSSPGKLCKEAMSLIKRHPETGHHILEKIKLPWPIARITLEHHERIDGSGYPKGLIAGQICREALIIAVADVVEAMASHRPYRPALGIDAALGEIEKNRGVLYDPLAADACLRLFRQRGYQLQAP